MSIEAFIGLSLVLFLAWALGFAMGAIGCEKHLLKRYHKYPERLEKDYNNMILKNED